MDLSPPVSTLTAESKRTPPSSDDDSHECEASSGLLRERHVEELEFHAEEGSSRLHSMDTDACFHSPYKESACIGESAIFHSKTAVEKETRLSESGVDDSAIAEAECPSNDSSLENSLSGSKPDADVAPVPQHNAPARLESPDIDSATIVESPRHRSFANNENRSQTRVSYSAGDTECRHSDTDSTKTAVQLGGRPSDSAHTSSTLVDVGNDSFVADADSETAAEDSVSVISASTSTALANDRSSGCSSLSSDTSSSMSTKAVSSGARIAPATPESAGYVKLCAQDVLCQGDENCVLYEHTVNSNYECDYIQSKDNSRAEPQPVRANEMALEERKCASSADHSVGRGNSDAEHELGMVHTSNVDLSLPRAGAVAEERKRTSTDRQESSLKSTEQQESSLERLDDMESFLQSARDGHTRFLKREDRRSVAEYRRLMRRQTLDEVADALQFKCWYPSDISRAPGSCMCNKCSLEGFELHEVLAGEVLLVAAMHKEWSLCLEVCDRDDLRRFPLLRAGIGGMWAVRGRNCNGWTALHFAAHFNRVDVLQAILRRGGIDVDTLVFPEKPEGIHSASEKQEAPKFPWGEPVRIGGLVRVSDHLKHWYNGTILRIDSDAYLVYVQLHRYSVCSHVTVSINGHRVAPGKSNRKAARQKCSTTVNLWTAAQIAAAAESCQALECLLVHGASVFVVGTQGPIGWNAGYGSSVKWCESLTRTKVSLYRHGVSNQAFVSQVAQKNRTIMATMSRGMERRRQAQALLKQRINDLMYHTRGELPREICSLVVTYIPETAIESETSSSSDNTRVRSWRNLPLMRYIFGAFTRTKET